MTATVIASMIVEDVDPSSRLGSREDPIDCDHVWEPHLWDTGRAYCPRCRSFARWVNDPRLMEEPSP